jgi:DNA-binding NarL/FixJ family response regulator
MTAVLLVDDHPLFRHALRSIISRKHAQLEINEAETLRGARSALSRQPETALVLLDMKLSDSHGFNGLLSLKSEFPKTPIAIISASCDTATVNSAIAFGAAGFIPKSAKRADIALAITTILSGDLWTPSTLVPSAIPEHVNAIASLTPAQLRIFQSLQRGLRNKEIAQEMGVAERTVKAYMCTMFIKLGVTSRTQAVILAQRLVPGDSLSS